MTNALIGFTGFIGSNLCESINFDYKINRNNLSSLLSVDFDEIICAGLPAEKWRANIFPDEDLLNINLLINTLSKVKTRKFTLISTIDIYDTSNICYENTANFSLEGYGKNRKYFEDFISNKFSNFQIIRLPGVFGNGLKKNVIYDLIHSHQIDKINFSNIYQWYPIIDLPIHIDFLRNQLEIKFINLCSEPISVEEIVSYCSLNYLKNDFSNNSIKYDIRSLYSHHFNSSNEYIYSKIHILNCIKDFVDYYSND
jgi:nucleoside-diphosphate-sugar epimerase